VFDLLGRHGAILRPKSDANGGLAVRIGIGFALPDPASFGVNNLRASVHCPQLGESHSAVVRKSDPVKLHQPHHVVEIGLDVFDGRLAVEPSRSLEGVFKSVRGAFYQGLGSAAAPPSEIPPVTMSYVGIVNLAARGMLVVSVARRLGSEGPLLAYCAAPL
jgi:hypothetical protein